MKMTVQKIKKELKTMRVVLPQAIEENLKSQCLDYIRNDKSFKERVECGVVFLSIGRPNDLMVVEPEDRFGIVREIEITNDDSIIVKYEVYPIISLKVKNVFTVNEISHFVAVPACLCDMNEKEFSCIVSFTITHEYGGENK